MNFIEFYHFKLNGIPISQSIQILIPINGIYLNPQRLYSFARFVDKSIIECIF